MAMSHRRSGRPSTGLLAAYGIGESKSDKQTKIVDQAVYDATAGSLQQRFNLAFANAYFPMIPSAVQDGTNIDFSKPLLVMPGAGESKYFSDIYFYYVDGVRYFLCARYLLSGLNGPHTTYGAFNHGIYPAIMLLNWKVLQLGYELVWAYYYPKGEADLERKAKFESALKNVATRRRFDFDFEVGTYSPHTDAKHKVSYLMLYVVKRNHRLSEHYARQSIVYDTKNLLSYWLLTNNRKAPESLSD